MHIHTAARSLGSAFLCVEPIPWETKWKPPPIHSGLYRHLRTRLVPWSWTCKWREHQSIRWLLHHLMMGFSSKINMVSSLNEKKVCTIMWFMVKCSVCQHMDLFKTPFINPCTEYSLLKHWLSRPSHCSLSPHSLFPYRALEKVAVTPPSPQPLVNKYQHSHSPPEWAGIPPLQGRGKNPVSPPTAGFKCSVTDLQLIIPKEELKVWSTKLINTIIRKKDAHRSSVPFWNCSFQNHNVKCTLHCVSKS